MPVVPTVDDGLSPEDEEFVKEIHRLLLSMVCVWERRYFSDKPTTSELRKAGKSICKVDVKQE